MDAQWTLPVVPTVCAPRNTAVHDQFLKLFPEYKKLSDNEFIVEQVRGLTVELTCKRHYCPATWTARAYNLLRLGYPDLALGDAYKATMLLEKYKQTCPPGTPVDQLKISITKAIWRQTKESVVVKSTDRGKIGDKTARMKDYIRRAHDRASMILAQALFIANCYVECYEFLKDYQPTDRSYGNKYTELQELAERAQMLEDLSRFQDEDYVSHADPASVEARRSGSIVMQIYPWSSRWIERGDKLLSQIRSNMRIASQGQCQIETSGITDAVGRASVAEVKARTMGIKSMHNCNAGELLLTDRTFLSGVDYFDPLDSSNTTRLEDRCETCRRNLPTQQFPGYEASCCNARFCSAHCQKLSDYFHFVLCESAHVFYEHPALRIDHECVSTDTVASNDLLYRLFAYLENNPTIHPLLTPVVSAMIPAFRNTSPVIFSFANDIKRPLALLQLLENDIWKDACLDTWVLQTIQSRVRNNVRAFTDESGHYHVAINLLYTFFNHSCDPNVKITTHGSGSSRLYAHATRSIRRGEELFINYLDEEDLDLPYAQRQELLQDWTGGECQCQRCQREQSEMEAAGRQNNLERNQSVLPQKGDAIGRVDVDERDLDLPTNRYATEEALVESHPAMLTLKRQNPIWERQALPLDYDAISDGSESPLRKKARRLGIDKWSTKSLE